MKAFITIPMARADAGRIVDVLEANAKLLQANGYPAEAVVARNIAKNIQTAITESK